MGTYCISVVTVTTKHSCSSSIGLFTMCVFKLFTIILLLPNAPHYACWFYKTKAGGEGDLQQATHVSVLLNYMGLNKTQLHFWLHLTGFSLCFSKWTAWGVDFKSNHIVSYTRKWPIITINDPWLMGFLSCAPVCCLAGAYEIQGWQMQSLSDVKQCGSWLMP